MRSERSIIHAFEAVENEHERGGDNSLMPKKVPLRARFD